MNKWCASFSKECAALGFTSRVSTRRTYQPRTYPSLDIEFSQRVKPFSPDGIYDAASAVAFVEQLVSETFVWVDRYCRASKVAHATE
jgi:hypothetical protein